MSSVDEERRASEVRTARDRIYHLSLASYIAITLILVAFVWHWWSSNGFTQASSPGPLVLMGLAALAYVVIRVLLFQTRRRLKEMKQ